MIEAVINGKPGSEKAECFDCSSCKAAIGWWCVNDEAIKRRGTREPNNKKCKNWTPVKSLSELGFFEKHFGDYIVISREAK